MNRRRSCQVVALGLVLFIIAYGWADRIVGQSVTDYEMPPIDTTRVDRNGNCVPDHFERPALMWFRVDTIPGIGEEATPSPPKVYCFPPEGVASDSLVLYFHRCDDPPTLQVRLYTSSGDLFAVLTPRKGCPGTWVLRHRGLQFPSRRLTLEIVTPGLRRTRVVTLGRSR